MYFSYHAKAKKLIKEGHLVKAELADSWNGISPALVLFFDNHRPMPIREYRWHEYEGYIKMNIKSKNNMGSIIPL